MTGRMCDLYLGGSSRVELTVVTTCLLPFATGGPPAAINGTSHYISEHNQQLQYGSGGAVAATAQEGNNSGSSSSTTHNKSRLSVGGKPLSPIPEGTVPAVIADSNGNSNSTISKGGAGPKEGSGGVYKDFNTSSDPIVSPARLTLASRVKAARLFGGTEGFPSEPGGGEQLPMAMPAQDKEVGSRAAGGKGPTDLQSGALARLSELALGATAVRHVREGGGSREAGSSSS